MKFKVKLPVAFRVSTIRALVPAEHQERIIALAHSVEAEYLVFSNGFWGVLGEEEELGEAVDIVINGQKLIASEEITFKGIAYPAGKSIPIGLAQEYLRENTRAPRH